MPKRRRSNRGRSAPHRPRKKQRRADAADGLTSCSFMEGSNMTDETTPEGLWDRTKAWADKNRTISGPLVGGAAGTCVPGIGNVTGEIRGAGGGFATGKKRKKHHLRAGRPPGNPGT